MRLVVITIFTAVACGGRGAEVRDLTSDLATNLQGVCDAANACLPDVCDAPPDFTDSIDTSDACVESLTDEQYNAAKNGLECFLTLAKQYTNCLDDCSNGATCQSMFDTGSPSCIAYFEDIGALPAGCMPVLASNMTTRTSAQ